MIDELPWTTYRRVLVKPNLVVSHAQHAITHRNTLETILALLRQRYQGMLTVAEGCAIEPTLRLRSAPLSGTCAKIRLQSGRSEQR
ncbi:MAG: DUF362 domain-containing protein [Anaerolineales bacterium]|nr:DUF362 domain-containing protein [Anaerolineales bacterium]